jgi:ribonuclease P protein component
MPATVQHDRLRRSPDIAAVLRGRTHRAGDLVVLRVLERDEPPGTAGPARVAVVASRKVGTAVSRNRAKRVLREAVRTLPLRAGVDVVLIARAATAVAHGDRVRDEVERLATDLGLLAVHA